MRAPQLDPASWQAKNGGQGLQEQVHGLVPQVVIMIICHRKEGCDAKPQMSTSLDPGKAMLERGVYREGMSDTSVPHRNKSTREHQYYICLLFHVCEG